MQKVKWLFPVLFICLHLVVEGQQLSYTPALRKMSYKECISLIKQYKESWQRDSLALSGIREILGWEFIGRCDSLRGTDWPIIEQLLGRPDFVVKDIKEGDFKGQSIYRYVLTCYPGEKKDWKALGIRVLEFWVLNGKIIDLGRFENDG